METAFDYVLLAALLVLVPANSLWRSLAPRKTKLPRMTRYGRTIAIVGVLLALLAADWSLTGRSLASLGLDIPPSPAGLIGLAVAIALIAGMVVMVRKGPRRGAEADAAALMPQSPLERQVFILFSLMVGIGWELLYRGFLLWALTPWLTLAGAIPVAAIVYGLAHGYQSRRLFRRPNRHPIPLPPIVEAVPQKLRRRQPGSFKDPPGACCPLITGSSHGQTQEAQSDAARHQAQRP